MPRMKLTKSVIDNLAASGKDVVYWDAACPGFGVKVTPAGRKVFVVLYRTGSCWFPAAKIYHRALRSGDLSPGPRVGAEGVCRQAGGT
jgi:hypothetical protein